MLHSLVNQPIQKYTTIFNFRMYSREIFKALPDLKKYVLCFRHYLSEVHHHHKHLSEVFLTFTSLQSFDRLGRRGDTRDESAEIPFQSFLQEALVSSSGMDRDVHFFMLSIEHFLCRLRVAHPPRCPEGWFCRGCCSV